MRKRCMLLVVALCIATLASSCTNTRGRSLPRSANIIFQQGYARFQRGDWRGAESLFTRFLREYRNSSATSEVHYYRGLARQRLGRRKEARRDFEACIARGGPKTIVTYAKVSLANLYYEEGKDAPAVHLYANVLKDPPTTLAVDMVLFRLAVSLQRLGRWRDADKYLSHMIKTCPKALLIQDAKRRYRARYFTVQVGAYTQATTAHKQAAKLRKAGFKPWFATVMKKGRQFHTVRSGKSATYAGVLRLAKRIRAAGFKTLIVP